MEQDNEIDVNEISNEDLEDEKLLSDIDDGEMKDTLSSFLDSIKQYPLLTFEEEKELLKKYFLNNDLNAKEKLINSNLRFVVFKAKKYINRITYSELIDLIQEGNIGLIQAIEHKKLESDNRLIALANYYIEGCIKAYIAHKDKTIDIKKAGISLLKKYNEFVDEYKKNNGIYPSDEIIMEDLDINQKQLFTIKNIKDNLTNISSLDKNLKVDEDEYSLGDIVPDYDKGYDDFLDSIDERSILYRLKNNLNSFEYYIMYHVILENDESLYQLAEALGTKSYILNSKLDECRKKIKNNNILEIETNLSIKKLCELNLEPINYPKKVVLMYIKDKVDTDVIIYLYYAWYLNLPHDKLEYQLSRFGISDYNIYSIYNYKLDKLFNNNYKKILKIVRNQYSIDEVFNYAFDFENNAILNVSKIMNKSTKDEIISMLGDEYYRLPPKHKKILDDYYENEYEYISPTKVDFVESKINVQLLRYNGDRELSLKKLYNIYLKNKDEFDEEHQEYLEGTLFTRFTKKKVKFNKKISDRIPTTIIRLEELYYNLNDLSQYTLTSDLIKETIEKHQYLFKDDEIKSLYMHYAIGYEKKYSEKEIMKELNLSKDEVRYYLNYGYRKVTELYLGVFNNYVLEDEDIYIKYINDPYFPLKDKNREVLRLRYVEHLDYKDIKEKLGFNNTREVSNMIKKATYLIDCHEYNINAENKYEEYRINNMLDAVSYNEIQKEIIKLHFIENASFESLSSCYDIKILDIKRLCSDFCANYIRYFAKKELSFEEIERELTCHITDSILNENQRFVLSKLYGIKCDSNKDGEKLSRKELSKLLNKTGTDLSTIINYSEVRIGARINGIMTPNLGILSQKEVIDALNNKNIPLSDEEKSMLRQIKGIDTETLTMENLAEIYNINIGSVKRRINLAYLSILKYQRNNKGYYDYEKDIEPILKYFPLYEKEVLIDLYKNKLSVDDMMKKYILSSNSVRSLVKRVDKKAKYIIEYPYARVFDFDYAREVIQNNDLPFYGEKEKAYEMYVRHFGDDGNPPVSTGQIIDDLVVSENTKTNYVIKRLMIACLMYKDGYRKLNTITSEEVKSTYERHKDEYNKFERGIFETYFKIDYEKNLINGRTINDFIIYEVLKDKNNSIRHLKDMSLSEIHNIIKNNPFNLTKAQLEFIRNYRKIPKKHLMSGKRKIKLYKILEKGLYNSIEKSKSKEKVLEKK